MTNNLPKYENYKASGVEWLGEIPEHWEVKKLKHIFFEKKKKTNPALDSGSISFGKVVTKNDEKIPISTKASYQEVLKGDFLVNPLNLNYDLISLRIALSYINVVVSSGYIVLNSTKVIDKEYFKYLLHRYDVAYMKLLGSGVRQTINFNDIADSLLSFPPLQEQTAIASFIDQKTAKIDQAIAQKVKLISLLKERRQILIHHAVTKGLDSLNFEENSLNFDLNEDRNTMILNQSPSKNSLNFDENDDLNTMISKPSQTNQSPSKNHQKSKFRHSGVDWIGEIPEHWEVKSLKYIAYLKSGEMISAEQFTEEGYPVFGGNGFRGFTNSFTNDGEFALIGRQGALCGNVNYAQGKFFASEHAIVVYPLQNQNILWLGEAIKRADFNRLSQSAAQPGIAVNVIKNIQFPYPSIDEQKHISDYIKSILEKTSTAISLKEKEIEKLKEYKATLINSAVTGKINVSDYA